MIDLKKCLTPCKVANKLGVSPRSVYRWIRDGLLPAHKLGARYYVQESALEGLLKEVKPREENAAERAIRIWKERGVDVG
jgi:excisionase family DNA binding protein